MSKSRAVFIALLSGLLAAAFLAALTAEQPKVQPVKKADAASPDYVMRMEVRRVPLDVVVTDKDGKPVRGLKKDDFILKEDKKLQHALSFEYSDGSAPSFIPPKAAALPENTFVNVPRQPERGPLYILYYDMVNTPQTDQMAFHKQLFDFVDHAQPGTRIALFVNTKGLHMLQGFTSDHTLLRTALMTKGPGPHMPDVFIFGENYGKQDVGAALSNLNFLAEYFSGIPGRKNLLWMSGTFPIPVGPVQKGHGPTDSSISTLRSESFQRGNLEDLTYLEEDGIKHTYAALMRSQIALYPIDLGGVNPAEDPGDALTNFDFEKVIAAATGGNAYYSSNRIDELLDKAVADGESYYSLSYSPTNTKVDTLPRNIEVTLAKKGDYTLAYRRLYYVVPDNEVQQMHKRDALQSRFLTAKSQDTLYANIEHGAPMLHDLLFSAHVTAVGAPAMATAEQMASLEDSPAYFKTRKKNKTPKPLTPVPLQKYRINYGIFDPQLKATASHKAKPALLEFAAAAYDDDGKLLNSTLNDGEVTPGTKADGATGTLFHAEQELSVPPGVAWIRLAVRDQLNDRTGTMEIRLPLKAEADTMRKGD